MSEETIIVDGKEYRIKADQPEVKFNYLTWNAQEKESNSNILNVLSI